MTYTEAQKLGYEVKRGHHHGTTEPRADKWYIVRRPGQAFEGQDYRGSGFRTRRDAVECIAEERELEHPVCDECGRALSPEEVARNEHENTAAHYDANAVWCDACKALEEADPETYGGR